MKRNQENRSKTVIARALACMAFVLLAAACASAQKSGAIDIPSRVNSSPPLPIPDGNVHDRKIKRPTLATIKARICVVSGKLANKYCPAHDVRVKVFTKGLQPKAYCTVHHKPVMPKQRVSYVTVMKCPVGGELYPASARFCIQAAHKIKGRSPRLIAVRVPKR